MQLLCLLEHLHGQDVLVDGTTYSVGLDGMAHVPEPLHAKALLANTSGWMLPPEPLMPLGEDGQPEHVAMPPKKKATYAANSPKTLVQAYTDPGLVAHIPATDTVGEPVTGIDFEGHVVTEADEIRAKEISDADKPVAVSAPSAPVSATVAKTSSRKGKHR